MPTFHQDLADKLAARLDANEYSERDRSFAASLLDGFVKYGRFTDRQLPYVQRLAENRNTAAPAQQVGDLGGVLALFDKAAAHLKRPAVVLAVPGVGNGELRLTVAGAKAKQPGTVNVTDTEADWDSRTWYGRIQRDGTYQPSRDANGTSQAITEKLRALAKDPVGVASEFGRLTGRCCFCNRALSDERSTAVGYGGTCADHFGLPWGKRPEEFAAAAAV
jgi:hypothetical protein